MCLLRCLHYPKPRQYHSSHLVQKHSYTALSQVHLIVSASIHLWLQEKSSCVYCRLKWPTLQICRKLSRLQILHKIHYQQLSLQIPHYYLPKTRPTIQYHHLHYILPTSSTTAYQNSYFSRTINEWNILPTDTIEIADTDHIIVPNVFVYVIPEHTSRADCSVNNNNNNSRAAPILVSISVSGRYCCFHEVSESAIVMVADSYQFLSHARIK